MGSKQHRQTWVRADDQISCNVMDAECVALGLSIPPIKSGSFEQDWDARDVERCLGHAPSEAPRGGFCARSADYQSSAAS